MKEPIAYRLGNFLKPFLVEKEHRILRWTIRIMSLVALIIAIYFVGRWLNVELGVGSGSEEGFEEGTEALKKPLFN